MQTSFNPGFVPDFAQSHFVIGFHIKCRKRGGFLMGKIAVYILCISMLLTPPLLSSAEDTRFNLVTDKRLGFSVLRPSGWDSDALKERNNPDWMFRSPDNRCRVWIQVLFTPHFVGTESSSQLQELVDAARTAKAGRRYCRPSPASEFPTLIERSFFQEGMTEKELLTKTINRFEYTYVIGIETDLAYYNSNRRRLMEILNSFQLILPHERYTDFDRESQKLLKLNSRVSDELLSKKHAFFEHFGP